MDHTYDRGLTQVLWKGVNSHATLATNPVISHEGGEGQILIHVSYLAILWVQKETNVCVFFFIFVLDLLVVIVFDLYQDRSFTRIFPKTMFCSSCL